MNAAEALQAALDILQEEARTLFECSTTNGAWINEPEAMAQYDKILAVIAPLRQHLTALERQDGAPPSVAAPENFAAEWHAIDYAPHDRRLLVKSESGEIYAGRWVQDPMTGDEAFCVSEAPDGTQHLVKPVEWREIDPPQLQAISDFGQLQTALETVADLRKLLSEAADEIAEWGAYASGYFQQKHDLPGTVARFRKAAEA